MGAFLEDIGLFINRDINENTLETTYNLSQILRLTEGVFKYRNENRGHLKNVTGVTVRGHK